MDLITLYATKVKETSGHWKGYNKTVITNEDGTPKAIFPAEQTQPKKGKITININCFKYKLIWK